MYFRLLPFFTLVPLVELYLLIRIGALFGAGITILIVLSTGVIGTYLARQEGFQVWLRVQRSMQQGLFPADELIDGLLIFAAGLMLITPGVLTDALGFLLLIPFTRLFFRRWLMRRFSGMIRRGNSSMGGIFWSGTGHVRDVTNSEDEDDTF
jgi:UPF0716 protein FxsA